MPTEQDVFTKLRPLVAEVTGVREDAITMQSLLVEDLGAESIDLLDLTFLIEQEFGVTIGPNEFEGDARQRLPDVEYEEDGYLTEEALAELRRLLPEVDRSRLVPGLRKADVPLLLNVAVFVHLIQRKAGEGARA